MKAFVTYCSAQKNQSTENLKAIDLYKSERIKLVKEQAENNAISFYVLSGKYGLLYQDDKIPYYDHLLLASEVQEHAKLVLRQLENAGISHVTFFATHVHEDPNVQAYLECIKLASEAAGIQIDFHFTSYSD